MSRHAGKGGAKAALVSSVVPFMLKTGDNPEGTAPSVFDAMTKGMTEDRVRFFGSFFKDFFGVGVLSHGVSDGLQSRTVQATRLTLVSPSRVRANPPTRTSS